jgi:phosphopantothenoylcysteine decarboxylase / phosphopantothenate---cysteine ligase
MALIAVGVSGGIGAYKAPEVVRGLQKRGHDVVAILTRGAQQFVTPLTFEALTRRTAITDQWATGLNTDVGHIALTTEVAALVVAPATANLIAKLAHGLADDFLTTFALATRCPILLAPAMNTQMLAHPAVEANLATLRGRGVQIVEPGSGYLACGWVGPGRLAEPEDIVAATCAVVEGGGAVSADLEGRRVLVTAGPTYEDLDPVRYVGNRSSGRMGVAVAGAAARRGAAVTLVLGPSSVTVPAGLTTVRVRSAAEMHAAVMQALPGQDVVVMAAAVADYTPTEPASQKIAKSDGPLTVTLSRTRDILADLGAARDGARRPLLVGFAAETADAVARGRRKLEAKRVDLVVANDVTQPGAGFEHETNAVTILGRDGDVPVPLQAKTAVADRILDRVVALLQEPA